MSTYSGDISPRDSWEKLKSTPEARLVDVRTQAEWQFVGLPDLSSLETQPVLVSWQVFPTMTKNDAFAQQLAAQGIGTETPLLFLCRSGVRSKAAAELMTSLGYKECWNISDGFEGPLDESRHRGSQGGWKAQGLPWLQG
ncbi:rhodanese-like domain-containing protein [Magnetospirillum gryphiswaldense]|uniref:Rhodanese-related sulfurtransferase n=1 Tax=Magnetospirillum gryphiswaldense TaxID=55518 RepID=A4U0Q7_9PROT|nr:rhodanese-like domain-containing protein [Magnetospirillum gryphiswaldense]AVM74238.1 Thiosulfate sulfurtransferase GlpE [Magnetospirillum gryphiswaldense MSR-1]AVM78141.1 Thiosulfate sulfurtransferase GlpE [Magnetospirillum gryphiswaldense]CAM76464.1 Rhodanese-related sulfurtransferase [Magnetospirillum gryphiswaldense MSR-1]